MSTARKYHVLADQIDWRDKYYNFARSELRESVDMRPMAGAIEEQSHLGSCTAQAIIGGYELMLKQQYPDHFKELSRLFVYYNARMVEGADTSVDEGVYIRDALKAVNQYGICKESLWPYDISKFSIRPPTEAYNDAMTRTIKEYYRISNLRDILDSLNADHPVVAGLIVYDGFERITPNNPILEMPRDTDRELGAHAVLFVGYDLGKKCILVRNSFGTRWGDHGYFWLPFDYVEQDLTDAWSFDIKIA